MKETSTHLVKSLKGYKLYGTDGALGEVKEFYFDDHHWTVRYLVADTGNWLNDQKVLISPYSIASINGEGKTIDVRLTKKQIEDSPSLATDKPVSKQFEESYYGYYGWPEYWGTGFRWGSYYYPYRGNNLAYLNERPTGEGAWDPHLRSSHDVSGHHVEALDGALGHVEDFVIDEETWAIRYLVIDTRNWWPGKRVLISPKWVDSVSWAESKVFVHLTREAIQSAPEFDTTEGLTRDYETKLHRHYDLPGYWDDEPSVSEKLADEKEEKMLRINRGTGPSSLQKKVY